MKKFCQIIRNRSEENDKAMKLLIENQLYGKVVESLRTELDSFVRVVYLMHQNRSDRNRLVTEFMQCKKWNGVTDRKMVNLSSKKLFGWEEYVYNIGCGFIHLSAMHNYNSENPFDFVPDEDKEYIKTYLNSYYKFPLEEDLNMTTIIPYLYKVFSKIRSNLLLQVEKLEKNKETYTF